MSTAGRAGTPGRRPSPRIRFVPHDCLRQIGRGVSGRHYRELAQSVRRLRMTTVITNIRSADEAGEVHARHVGLASDVGDASGDRRVGCLRDLERTGEALLGLAPCRARQRVEGRLEFRGPSATSGYWRNPEQTARLLHDGWLDSGDRGECRAEDRCGECRWVGVVGASVGRGRARIRDA